MERILALIDFSDATPALLKAALEFSQALKAKLILMHVAIPPMYPQPDESQPPLPPSEEDGFRQLKAAERKLQIIEMELKVQGVDASSVLIAGDPQAAGPAKRILQELDKMLPDLIIVGPYGHGRLHDLIIGSVTDMVGRNARCPVLLVPR